MERSEFLTAMHKLKLKQVRAMLCDIQDFTKGGLHPASEEYQKITEIIEKIEKVLGVI